jgi:hypothetical protein
VQAYTNRGVLYERQGKKDLACKDWQLACKLNDKGACQYAEKDCR